MSKSAQPDKTIALYAAGIGASLPCFVDEKAWENLSEKFGGWDMAMDHVADCAEWMEKFRLSKGDNMLWAEDLPSLYDCWDAIAEHIANYNRDTTGIVERLHEISLFELLESECAKEARR